MVNGILVGPEEAAQILEMLGYQAPTPQAQACDYWAGWIGFTIGSGVIDLLQIAGFLAPGAFLWRRQRGNQKGDPAR